MAKRWYSNPFRLIFLSLTAIGAAGLCYLIANSGKSAADKAGPHHSNNRFAADEPLHTMPEHLEPGLILLTPDQIVNIPVADGFQWPVGAPNLAMMYDAQPFAAMNDKRGGHHVGQDLNGIGGENTDLAEPVTAAARGLVIYSGEPSESWGNVVVIAHRLPDSNDVIQTLYAHLNERNVRPGQVVGRGQRIGSIGTAHNHYLAHLHFEAAKSLCNEAGMPGYHPGGTMNRINPEELIAAHPAPSIADPYEQARRLLISEAANAAPTTTTTKPMEGTIQLNPSQFLKQ